MAVWKHNRKQHVDLLLGSQRQSSPDAHRRKQQAETSRRILHARRVLISEAISIFRVESKPNGVWSIAGRSLPSADRMQCEYSPRADLAITNARRRSHRCQRCISASCPSPLPRHTIPLNHSSVHPDVSSAAPRGPTNHSSESSVPQYDQIS
jgi:hypothetical protein